jgi:hypothetical protein
LDENNMMPQPKGWHSYSHFASFTFIQSCLCVYIITCNFITCVGSHDHHRSKYRKQFSLKDSWSYPLLLQWLSPQFSSLTLLNLEPVLHFLNFVSLRMLCRYPFENGFVCLAQLHLCQGFCSMERCTFIHQRISGSFQFGLSR